MRSSLTSNIDLKPVPQKVREEMEMVERFVDAKEKLTRGQQFYQGVIAPSRHDGKTYINRSSVNASAEDIRQALAGGDTRWYKPIGYTPGGEAILTEPGKEAVRLGYVCPNCFNAQAFPNLSECRVRGKEWGCGWTRGFMGTVY